ncbi:MAG: amidohydrolase family protein [Acidimicrobiales bacterium]
MIVDAHVHLGSFPSLAQLGGRLRRAEDVVAFRTRYPELYQASLSEDPVDNSDDLIAALEAHGITAAVVQARPGLVPNDLVAAAVLRHADRLVGLVRIGHEHLVAGYVGEVPPERARAAGDEVARGVEELGLRGVGEVFVRAFTTSLHPEQIADDLAPIMETVCRYQVPIQFPTAWSQFPGGLYWADPVWTDEVAGRYPEVPIVLTKMGRGVGRYFDAALAVALRNENVYLDTVGTTPGHLATAVRSIGARRVMFGTDWSATWRYVTEPQDLFTQRLSVVERAELSEEERLDVLGRTASRLFGLEANSVPSPPVQELSAERERGGTHG